MEKILIVDDNPAVCDALKLLLSLHDLDAVACYTPQEAIKALTYQRIALVIQDMNFTADTTSGEEGKALFRQLREIQPEVPIILLTAWTQLETAVSLVKQGAADYLGKPWDDVKLLNTITNLLELGRLKQQNQTLVRRENERRGAIEGHDNCGLVYQSASMQRLVEMALQVSRSDIPVLISGPNGAGKEKIAEIVQANSPLRDKPFIKVNMGALPSELMEAELFGAEAGAFTGNTKTRIGRFEAADGGTLFLDEIGNLSLSGQMKLLRVLQTGEFERLGSHQTRRVTVRVISATNADLLADVQQGRFREDLYYRLNVIELALPPLAERPDDILPLAEHFLSEQYRISKAAERALLAHDWPGNVRELENAVRRATVVSGIHAGEGRYELTVEDFGLMGAVVHGVAGSVAEPSLVEIQRAIDQHQGVIARAAKSLGLSRQALYRRMEKFGIAKS